MDDKDKVTVKLIRNLSKSVKSHISKGLSAKKYKPEQMVYYRWKLHDFKYDDNGPHVGGSNEEEVVRKSWWREYGKIQNELVSLLSYKECLRDLQTRFGTEGPSYLNGLVKKLVYQYLSDRTNYTKNVSELVKMVIRALKKMPFLNGVEIELEGVVLRPHEIKVSNGILLRRTTKKDLEKEISVRVSEAESTQNFYPVPTAILKMEFLDNVERDLGKHVQEAIAILRLFDVGSVKYKSYHMYTKSFFKAQGRGTITLHDGTHSLEKYLIRKEEIKKLKGFWAGIQSLLPPSFYLVDRTSDDHIAIAYKHYCDALLQNGFTERRIANAIMGLEALLLKSGEIHELEFRVKNRVAKLLAYFNFKPLMVRESVGDAYDVRNKFAHGSKLSPKERRRLERKYQNLGNLLRRVLDFLRIAIIAYMTSKVNKENTIDFIDDSFLDNKNQLSTSFSTTRSILSVKRSF